MATNHYCTSSTGDSGLLPSFGVLIQLHCIVDPYNFFKTARSGFHECYSPLRNREAVECRGTQASVSTSGSRTVLTSLYLASTFSWELLGSG